MTWPEYPSLVVLLQLVGVVKYTVSLQRSETPPPNESPGYDIKQSDGETPVMLGLWGMQITPSLPLFPGPLWPGVLAPDRVLSMGEIKLFDF